MQLIENVESNVRPEELTKYGKFGVDYNFDIEEVEFEYQVPKMDEFDNPILDENGEQVQETKTGITYVYKTRRFDTYEEYENWR